MPYYAIVFKKDFEPGDHWNPTARDDDPDRQQHWKKGDLYSTGSVVGKLPYHFEAVEIPGPQKEDEIWDKDTRSFVKRDVDAEARAQILAEIERLQSKL